MMPQMPSREKLLAWIDQVSFAVVEMNLYLTPTRRMKMHLPFSGKKWRFEKKH